ncbi:MAG: glycoside hydrolase family 3 N-terminal domain-containing protein [Brooklawnia sp.]|jgi:beta-N-acetylhexosaminidase
MRRTLTAAIGVCLLLAGCARGPAAPQPGSPGPTGTPVPPAPPTSATRPATPADGQTCLARAEVLGIADQVGQLYMQAIQVGTPVETAVEQLRASRAGAVILLGNHYESVEQIAQYTEQLQTAAPGIPVLVAVDQEGGQVQRLQGPGFDTIAPATEQGLLSDTELHQRWVAWGSQLASAGVNFNLAPVADVVPADQVGVNQPVGVLQRGFGSETELVAGKVAAVVGGLAEAGVTSSVKHFPGLGQVNENTDFAVGHDYVSTLSRAELAPFQAAIDAGAGSVMVSSAIYTQVDPDNPAVFSEQIVTGILREQLGFDGVVISDDLGVAASVASYPVAERGINFLAAGGDMVIVADAGATQTMVDATVALAETDPEFASQLAAKVARLLALKASVGLLDCQS